MESSDRPATRPRSKSGFSIKSAGSHGSKTKTRLSLGKESHEEKERHHLSPTGKANPNAAMNEAQPVAAALEAPTIGSLRSIEHVDSEGNPISEPDLSNPTRSRWERPLDTIRSFEAAIDGEYKRRAIPTRPSTAVFSENGMPFGGQSRRSSYLGGHDQYNNQPQSRVSRALSSYNSYYNQNRDSYYESNGDGYYGNGYGANNGYGPNGGYGPNNGYGANNGYGPPPPMSPAGRMRYERRQHSEPLLNRQNNGQPVYPSPGYQRSRDTVNTGGSNGSQSQSEPWTNHTDPSSENSSIDRAHQAAPKPPPPVDVGEQYGFSGFGAGPFKRPIAEEVSYENLLDTVAQGQAPAGGHPSQMPAQPPNGYARLANHPYGGAPAPPPKYAPNGQPPMGQARKAVRQDGGEVQPPSQNAEQRPALQSQDSQKRKSWLKRAFSKKE